MDSVTTPNWGLLGHEWAVDLLAKRLAANRLSHAYLITGPEQVGKGTLALRLAQAMNCKAAGYPSDGVPCGECRACTLIARGVHPDVQIVEAEGRSIRIEAIRDLQHDLSLHPIEGRYRLAIIRDFEKATESAQDALLKTLEEPAKTSRLILTANSTEELLATIVSRATDIPLRPVSAGELATGLSARFELPVEEAETLARLSGGRPGWAIGAIEEPERLEVRGAIIDALLAALRGNRTERFAYCETIARDDMLNLILDTWQAWWRDVLLLCEGASVQPVNADRMADLMTVARSITSEEARTALLAVRRTIGALDKYANTRLTLEVMMLDMPYL